MNGARSVTNATLPNVGRLLDGVFAIFDPRDFNAVFVNSAGMTILDPGGTASQEKINLLEILGESGRDRFQQEIRPRARLVDGWNGSLILRNLAGGEAACQVRIVEAPDSGDEDQWRLYLHAAPIAAEAPRKQVSDTDVLHALLETTPDRVYFKDAQSRFLQLSRALATALGASSPEEVTGKTDFDYFTEEHALPAYQQEMEIIRTGRPLVNIEEKETHTDGRVGWVTTTKLPFYRRDGTLIGTYGISRDITERKVAEEAMRNNLALFRAVFDGSNDAILLFSEQRFIDCNVRAEKLFGRDKTTILKMSVEDLSAAIQADGRPSAVVASEKISHAYEKGHCQFEWLHRRADGTTFPSEVSLSAFEFLGRKILHGSVRDISDRKKAEADRREWEDRLQLTSKLEAVGSLASGVAHEVNTPTQFLSDNLRFLVESFWSLDAVLCKYRELLKAVEAGADPALGIQQVKSSEKEHELDYLLEEVPRCLNQSQDGLRRIAKIVGSLKEFSHPGGGEMDDADLNRAIETTVAVSRHEWKYVADVVTELDPELPKVPCVLDEINQAVLNLVVNAAHAVADANKLTGVTKGLITIRTRAEGGNAIIEVQDSGTGIPENVRGRVFQPFFTTKPLGKGTGQGLAIVQSVIVKKHHGSVAFTTETGKGTTFILSLPLTSPNQSRVEEKT